MERSLKPGCPSWQWLHCTICFIILLLSMLGGAFSQTRDSLSFDVLKKLSLEELMNIEVNSVSKHPEKLNQAASAIQVIHTKLYLPFRCQNTGGSVAACIQPAGGTGQRQPVGH